MGVRSQGLVGKKNEQFHETFGIHSEHLGTISSRAPSTGQSSQCQWSSLSPVAFIQAPYAFRSCWTEISIFETKYVPQM